MNVFVQESGRDSRREDKPRSLSNIYKTAPPRPIFEDSESSEGHEDNLAGYTRSTKDKSCCPRWPAGKEADVLRKCEHQSSSSADVPRSLNLELPRQGDYLGGQLLFEESEESYVANYTTYSPSLDRKASSASPTFSEAFWAFAGAKPKVSRTPTLEMASIRLNDDGQEDVDHKLPCPDGIAYARDHRLTSPNQTELSIPSQAEPSQLESISVDDNHQEALMSSTESESGEEWMNSGFIPDIIQELWESSSDSKIPTMRAHALAIVRQALVEDAMTVVPFYGPQWTATFNNHAGHRGSASNSTSTSKSANHSSCNSSSSNHGRKRSRENEDDGLEDRDNEPPERSRADLDESRVPRGSLKLACPFRKHDAQKYNLNQYRVCALTPLDSIMRVKEHIKRFHKAPIYCPRCKQIFERSEAWKSHLAVSKEELCDLREVEDPEGVTPEMEKDLSGRWRAATPEELWAKIYKILFPGAHVPKPYFEPIHDPATSSYLPPYSTGVEMASPRKVLRALQARIEVHVDDHIKSLPERSKSELIRMALEECRNPANQDVIMERVPISVGSQNSRVQPLETFEQEDWDEPDSSGSQELKDKGKGRIGQIDMITSQQSTAPVEPRSPDVSVDHCFCPGQCECPPRARLSSMMRDFEFGQQYMDTPMNGDDCEG